MRLVALGAIAFSIIGIGCGVTANDGNASTPDVHLGDTVAAVADGKPEAAIHRQLQHALKTYARALRSGDVDTVQAVLSDEALSRIASNKNPADDFSGAMKRFTHREGLKLLRDVGDLDEYNFSIESIEQYNDGAVIAANISINGKQIPKPIYFVTMGNQYKINIAPPSGQPGAPAISAAYYRIQNNDTVSRTYNCSGGPQWTIAPYAVESRTCNNICLGGYTGTQMWVKTCNCTAHCEYQTFGVDMTIVNGAPICTDYC